MWAIVLVAEEWQMGSLRAREPRGKLRVHRFCGGAFERERERETDRKTGRDGEGGRDGDRDRDRDSGIERQRESVCEREKL